MQNASVTETRIAYGVVALGAAFAAAVSGWNAYFLGNFLFMWGPPAALCVLLLALRARPAMMAGASLATTVHLALFCLWVSTLPAREGAMTWIGYVFALPGGGCAALLAAASVDQKRSYLQAVLLSFGITLAGFSIGQALVWGVLL